MSGMGLIGELEVVSKLEKEKFEIYIPIKDKGIDFIGVKNNNLVQIQVKTSKFQKNSYFWFDLYKSKMRYHKNIFYIFVCRGISLKKFMGKRENFFVVPSLEIKEWINNNKMSSKKNNANVINLFLYPNLKDKTWYYKGKGKEIDFTKYWNNFELLDK